MNSQPKEEQAQKGKNMQECRPEEGYAVGHLVIGQAWKCWAVEFLDPREKQSKLLWPMLASMQRPGLMSTIPLITHCWYAARVLGSQFWPWGEGTL